MRPETKDYCYAIIVDNTKLKLNIRDTYIIIKVWSRGSFKKTFFAKVSAEQFAKTL